MKKRRTGFHPLFTVVGIIFVAAALLLWDAGGDSANAWKYGDVALVCLFTAGFCFYGAWRVGDD